MKSRAVTGNSKRAIFINDVFGSQQEMVSKVRETLSLEENTDDFLTDEIILAPLHTDVAAETSEYMMSFLYSGNEDKTKLARKNCMYNLCGSICHALASRVKDERFAAHRNIDWLEMSQTFYNIASCCEIQLRNAGGAYGRKKASV